MSKTPSKKVNGSPRYTSLEDRLRIAREVNAYRKAHPKMLLVDALKAMGNPCNEGNYYAWNKRLELAEATRQANGGKQVEVHSFPLALIPEKHPGRTSVAKRGSSAPHGSDEGKQLAASLIKVLAKLLDT